MKLKKEFIVHNTGNETLLVPASGASFYGVVKGNKTFGAILALLGQDHSEAELVRAMAEQFDASEAQIARDVSKAVAELRKIGALDE